MDWRPRLSTSTAVTSSKATQFAVFPCGLEFKAVRRKLGRELIVAAAREPIASP